MSIEDLPDPEEFPNETFVVCLHDGDTHAEMAESLWSCVVKTKEELRTVTEVLDRLIAEDEVFEEATWTLVRGKRFVITPKEVERMASNAMMDTYDE